MMANMVVAIMPFLSGMKGSDALLRTNGTPAMVAKMPTARASNGKMTKKKLFVMMYKVYPIIIAPIFSPVIGTKAQPVIKTSLS